MITTSSTLFRYISRQFLINLIALMFLLVGLLYLLDVIELLRRAADMPHISVHTVLTMALMKMPYLGQSVMPMGILFAGIYTCWKLNKTSELVVIRSFGLSAWQFLSPVLICALLIGIFSTTVINPVSSLLLGKYTQMDNQYFNNIQDLVTVSKTGLWLRQPSEDGYALIHSENFDQKEWQMNKVTVLFFDNDDTFLRRIDSPVTYLRDGYWEIRQPLLNDKNGTQHPATKNLPTNLTSQKIEESLSDPDTISFWNIPEHINIMEETGFPATRLHIHFQSLLAQPFLFIAMILLAATFSLRPPRSGGVIYMVIFGVAVGFFIFFLQSMLEAFGVSQKIPVEMAAWSPSIIGSLLGGAALLHLEDG